MRSGDSLVGWSLAREDTYPIRYPWPRLSREEELLIHEVAEMFYEHPHAQQTHEQLGRVFHDYCILHAVQLDEEQQSYIQKYLLHHTLGAGPLTPLLEDNSLEEIALTGIGPLHPVRVYRVGKGWEATPLYFTDATKAIHLVNRLVQGSGKRLSAGTPTLNAPMEGHYRVHASMYPVCPSLLEVSIRKYVLHATRPEDLLRARVLSPRGLAYLSMALRADCNMLIVGNTGSGKTTTLNALLGGLPEKERLILVEETPELKTPHPHVVRLTPQGDGELSLSTLIRETLRMRPDRVVVGEIRFPKEGKAFMESILAGQGKGTYATFHGHTSPEALSRLRQFGLLESDLGWINILVVQKRWGVRSAKGEINEIRKICEISELVRTPKEKWETRPILVYEPRTETWNEIHPSRLVRERFEWNQPAESYEETLEKLTRMYERELLFPLVKRKRIPAC